MTPPKGSTVQRDLSAGTTSRCATNSNALEGSAMAALRRRATTALRPGAISRISGVKPSFCKTAATYFAAGSSPPGGFEVLILIRSVSHPCASCARAAVPPNCEVADGRDRFGGVFEGIPGPLTGDWPKSGVAATRKKARTRATGTCKCHTFGLPSTNPPSLLARAFGQRPGKIIPANVLHGMCFILARGYGGLTEGNSRTLRNFNG